MRVLGIDPSTLHTGVAVVGSGKEILHTEEIAFKKMVGFERVSSIVGRIMEVESEFSPDLIVIESLVIGHFSSAISLIELGSVLRYFLWQEGKAWLECPPTTLKKFVSGKGNAKKEDIMMHVLKNWGFESSSNNVADAVGLAMFGLGCRGEKFSSYADSVVLSAM